MVTSCVGSKIRLLKDLFYAQVIKRPEEGDYFAAGNCLYSYLGKGKWNRIHIKREEEKISEIIHRRQSSFFNLRERL